MSVSLHHHHHHGRQRKSRTTLRPFRTHHIAPLGTAGAAERGELSGSAGRDDRGADVLDQEEEEAESATDSDDVFVAEDDFDDGADDDDEADEVEAHGQRQQQQQQRWYCRRVASSSSSAAMLALSHHDLTFVWRHVCRFLSHRDFVSLWRVSQDFCDCFGERESVCVCGKSFVCFILQTRRKKFSRCQCVCVASL